MEEALRGLPSSFPGRATGLPEFSERAAHLLMAAADYALVPSRFEPCGLVAQCAVRYGTVPIVTAVGGLRDLVTPEVGFCMEPFGTDPSDVPKQCTAVAALVDTVSEAAAQYGTEAHIVMRDACMRMDVSWDGPAAQWEAALVEMMGTQVPPQPSP